MNLYNKHRPKDFKRIVGNEQSVAILQKAVDTDPKDRSHCYLFIGNSGCGKTTLAHILSSEFGCLGDNKEEFNSANWRGIDSARDIISKMQRKPTGGSTCRVFIMEEAHQFTKDAMEALLKPTENCPNHVYFMMTTTNPEKLTEALRSRMTVINVSSLTEEQLVKVMQRVLKLEKKELPDSILSRIASCAAGSARIALTTLEKVIALPKDQQKNFEAVIQDTAVFAIDLCRLLFRRNKATWKEVAAMLNTLTENPESVRLQVVGYANKCLLGGNRDAYNILCTFDQNYYNLGKAGLSKSCYEFIFGTDAEKD